MKDFLIKCVVSRAVLIATLVSGLSLARAQTQSDNNPQNPPAQRPRAQAGALGPAAFGVPFGPAAQRLMQSLTDEQRTSLREAMDGQREKTRDLLQKLRDARRELFEAGLAAKFDEETVRAKAMEAARLDAEMTVLRTKALSQMKPALSAEQIEKLKNAMAGGPPDGAGETRGRRSNFRRDQNDLPVPDQTPAQK